MFTAGSPLPNPTSKITYTLTDMSNLFTGLSNLTTLDLTSWDFSTITSTENMFLGLDNVETIYVESATIVEQLTEDTTKDDWIVIAKRYYDEVVSNITDFYTYTYSSSYGGYTLSFNSSFKTAISNNTAYVKNGVTEWIAGTALPNPGSTYNGYPVVSYISLFQNMNIITSVNLNEWDTSNVVYLTSMFEGCTKLNNLSGIADWDMRNVKYAQRMFYGCSSITSLTPLANWDIRNMQYMNTMFEYTSITLATGLENWDTSNVLTCAAFFANCTNLTNVNAVANWDTRNLRDMSSMFHTCTALTDVSALNSWSVPNLTTMVCAIHKCSKLTTINLSTWNPTKLTNLRYAFSNNTLLKTLYLNNMDLTNVLIDGTNNYYTFGSTYSLTYIRVKDAASATACKKLGGWSSSKVVYY